MPNDYGSPTFQRPDPDRQQTPTQGDDPDVIRAALAHKPNTGTRPPVSPIVRGNSSAGPPPVIDHSIKVDDAVADAGG